MGMMKYCSIDELDHFEFHDSAAEEIGLEEGKLVCWLRELNVTTENSQSGHVTDMRVGKARMTLEGVRLEWAKGDVSPAGRDGSVSVVMRSLGEFADYFRPRKDWGLQIICLDGYCRNGDGRFRAEWVFFAEGNDFFTARLSFDKAIVEWDEYSGKAWYADRRD